jgi:glutathione S-transferase
MKPHLISFKLCPFVQKAVLALLVKAIDFDIEYIDLESPPDWFEQVSPLGKVPVLKIGDEVLFESSVIVEYLDEVYGESLHPSDPLRKAQNRSWMEFGNECLFDAFNLITCDNQAAFNEQREALSKKMDQLENQLVSGPYFNGDTVSLVDLSFAPFFQRQHFIGEFVPGLIDPARHQKIARWSQALLQLPQLPDSAVPEIRSMYLNMIKNRGGYVATLMP